MDVKILSARSGKEVAILSNLSSSSTIGDVKDALYRKNSKYYPERQSYKTEPKGKSLKGDVTLGSLNITHGDTLYFKDLGPQVGWTTVFLTEYSGPLFVYLLFYLRPSLIYGAEAASQPRNYVVNLAVGCWVLHYGKRLLETVFIHRFSNATMPIMNIFKNSSYYWGFAAFIAYFLNHPLYTPPTLGSGQVYFGLFLFLLSEYGNFCIHVALRDLRPPGTKERRIPFPTSNPMTQMFRFVSCPNYTYETVAWIAFAIMTQCLPVLLFCLAGFGQMAIWAGGKHRNYKKEFKDYPRSRKTIIPFLL
ncbi:very-long-chain enoyl-CoA reductase-like [Diadema antillarum]|uniref:very-long-chain enoyl-CoA reductase-like n=1 Tax=Diadema antillarum TaxID=105358 RepID=UPI003A85FCD2